MRVKRRHRALAARQPGHVETSCGQIRDARLRVRQRSVTEGAGVQIIRMSQVENVVDQQFVVTVGRQITPDGGIGRRVREFTVVRNQTLVC